jgi:hypothetical protein
MTPSRRWAALHAPAGCQATAAWAFAAGARAFAEMMPNTEICVDALDPPYYPRMTTVMEFLDEFLTTEEPHG